MLLLGLVLSVIVVVFIACWLAMRCPACNDDHPDWLNQCECPCHEEK